MRRLNNVILQFEIVDKACFADFRGCQQPCRAAIPGIKRLQTGRVGKRKIVDF